MAPLDSSLSNSVPVDRALAIRRQHLQEALDLLIAKHGAHSETVALIRDRLDEVQAEILEDLAERTSTAEHGNVIELMGGPQVKDAGVMFVILGGVLIFALGGMSTMFILMMAAMW